MTTGSSRSTLHAKGAAVLLHRQRFTNQERLDTPVTDMQAIAIACDSNVPLDFRILAIHRLMDIASDLASDGNVLWGKIGATLQDEFHIGDIPLFVLVRFHKSVPFQGMRGWACAERHQRQQVIRRCHQEQAA